MRWVPVVLPVLLVGCSSSRSSPNSPCPDNQTNQGGTCVTLCTIDDDCSATAYCPAGSEICVDSVCGDGAITRGEECDTATANADSSACTLNCRSATCGDGLVWSGVEQCDDGADNGTVAGMCLDDCSGVCQQPPCVAGTVLDGGVVSGAGVLSGPTYRLEGQLGFGFSPTKLTSTSYELELQQHSVRK